MKRTNSESLFDKAQSLMPGGVNSPVRAFKNVDGKPIFFKSAKGPILIDEDENEYIDFIGSWGPMILGHSNPLIIDAVKAQLELGTSYGAPTKLENTLATIIKSQVPAMEKLRMVNSGTEATMSCIRLARGFTGKNKIIKFTGCYHGAGGSSRARATVCACSSSTRAAVCRARGSAWPGPCWREERPRPRIVGSSRCAAGATSCRAPTTSSAACCPP